MKKKGKHEILIKIVLIIALVVCILLLVMLGRYVVGRFNHAVDKKKNTSGIVTEQMWNGYQIG